MNQISRAAKGALNGSPALALEEAEIGDHHFGTSVETPLRPDAFDLSDPEKMQRVAEAFHDIMETLGLDMEDDSLRGTPDRVAKMFVQEIFWGLDPKKKPRVSLFENKFGYRQMLVEKNIEVRSYCEHHFLPIYGQAHVAYIPNGKVIGLSKLNRIVDYFARRPQVQERLCMQIADELKRVLRTRDVAVYLEAKHMCVEARGVEHRNSSTVTTEFDGKFLNENTRADFFRSIQA